MAVSVQDPIIEYTGNGSVVDFTFPFRVISLADLKVYLDGVEQGSGYSVTGINNPTGGTVTFVTPPASTVEVRLQRRVALSRTTDYVNGGRLDADTFDNDIDRVVQQIQDLDRVAFKETSSGDLDASDRKLINVADPVNDQDAVTKQWAETTVSSQIGIATTAANNASSSAASAAASLQTAQDIIDSFYISVKAEGAVGDGVTDDTTIIQTVLNTAAGRPVLIPVGTFMVDPLDIPSGTTVCGFGPNSVLKLKGSQPDGSHLIKNSDFVGGNTNIELRDFKLDGNQAGQTPAAGYNITCGQFNNVAGLKIKDMVITGGLAEGVYIYNSTKVSVINNDASGNGFYQEDASGIHLDTVDEAVVTNNKANTNGFHGIILTGVTNSDISDNICNGNGYEGMRIQYSSMYNTLTSNVCRGNGRFGMYLLLGSDANNITSNILNDNGVHGLSFNDSKHNLLANNRMQFNTYSGLYTELATDNQYVINNKISDNLYMDVEHNAGAELLTFNAIPPIVAGDAGKVAVVSSDETSYELKHPAQLNVHRKNYIINGNFDIWQRGVSHSTGTFGSVDRWATYYSGTSQAVSRQSFVLGQSVVPNNPKYYLRTVVTSVVGTSNYALIRQPIENVASGSNTTVTLSFWARADAAKNIAVEFAQNFGTGGSPSSVVSGLGVTTIPLTTAFQKFTVTVTLPSISGKTLGTDSNDHLQVLFWFDSGSTYSARNNSLGQQSGTFDIAQVQLEEGSVATTFEQRSVGEEFVLCQRYFQKYTQPALRGVVEASNMGSRMGMTLQTTMRRTPTVVLVGTHSVWNGALVTQIVSIISNHSDENSLELTVSLVGSLTTGTACVLYQDGTAAYTTLDAEI